MIKLIHAGVRRYLKSAIFWLSVLATICTAICCGYYTRNPRTLHTETITFQNTCILIELIIFAILISWIIGREYNNGIFRNKVIAGHTKTKIFLSEILLGFMACTLLFLIFAVIFGCYNNYVFKFVYFGLIIKIIIDVLLINLCYVSILVTISCLIPHTVAVITINIILVLVLTFTSEAMLTVIEDIEPEYIVECEYQREYRSDEYGNDYIVDIPIPGTEYKIENPNYTGNSFWGIYEVIYNILPYGHMLYNLDLAEGWFGIDDRTNDASIQMGILYYDYPELSVHIIYLISVMLVVCIIGVFCFRKKDLK